MSGISLYIFFFIKKRTNSGAKACKLVSKSNEFTSGLEQGEDVEEETEEEDAMKNKQVGTAKEQEKTPEATEKKATVTPSSDRPTRERKMVERYSFPERGRSTVRKTLSIEKVHMVLLRFFRSIVF